jgi:flagellar biosynthesis protein FliP
MKFIPYILIALSAAAGWLHLPALVIIAPAFLSAFIHLKARRKALQETPQAPDQNMLIDGIFLFFQQFLIMGLAFLLGLYATTTGGELFVKWIAGGR